MSFAGELSGTEARIGVPYARTLRLEPDFASGKDGRQRVSEWTPGASLVSSSLWLRCRFWRIAGAQVVL